MEQPVYQPARPICHDCGKPCLPGDWQAWSTGTAPGVVSTYYWHLACLPPFLAALVKP
jgi:hypothetical protein